MWLIPGWISVHCNTDHRHTLTLLTSSQRLCEVFSHPPSLYPWCLVFVSQGCLQNFWSDYHLLTMVLNILCRHFSWAICYSRHIWRSFQHCPLAQSCHFIAFATEKHENYWTILIAVRYLNGHKSFTEVLLEKTIKQKCEWMWRKSNSV